MPKPRKSSVVASVCFSLGLGVCLFHALYYQEGEGIAVVLRAWFVRTLKTCGRTCRGAASG